MAVSGTTSSSTSYFSPPLQTAPRQSAVASTPNGSLQLNDAQQLLFAKKIVTDHLFQSKDLTIEFQFNLFEFFQALVFGLQAAGIKIESFAMTGSQVVDVLLERERPHKDQDFLILISPGGNLEKVKEIFLRLLFKFSAVRYEKLADGQMCCYLKKGETAIIESEADLFTREKLDALAIYGNLMPTTLSVANLKIDITFAFDLKTSCHTSSDSFRGELLPFLEGRGALNAVSAADGYDAAKSLELMQMKRTFYVQHQHIANLREGLRGYIHIITSGIFPEDYSSEQPFLNRWQNEYPENKWYCFLKTIEKQFQKHYEGNHLKCAIYLLNLRTFFLSKIFEGKEKWLNQLDTFAHKYIGQSRVLEKIIFLHSSLNAQQARLDCARQSAPPRFRIDFPEGTSALLEAPIECLWSEALATLVNDELPKIPALFIGFYPMEKLLARLMTLPSNPKNLVGKLLILLVRKKRCDFIYELARNYQNLTPQQITQFEKLWELFSKNSRFSFGPDHLSFRNNAKLAALPYLTEDLKVRPPSQELLQAINVLSLPELNWPSSWVDFIVQHPENFQSFIKNETFKPLHLTLARILIRSPIPRNEVQNFLIEQEPATLLPSQELLQKVKHLPLKEWSEEWIDFIEQNPQCYEVFICASTFNPEFQLKVTARLLKDERLFTQVWPIACRYGLLPQDIKLAPARFLKPASKEITFFAESLLSLFECDRDLACRYTTYFYLTVSIEMLEKESNLHWRLLQLSLGRTSRLIPLPQVTHLNWIKGAMKPESEILPLIEQLLLQSFYTNNQLTETIADIIAMSKVFHPKLQLANRGVFAQNFFSVIIALFQDNSLMEIRIRILVLINSFCANPVLLPSLMQAANRSFNECLGPLAQDFEQAPELLKHYVHWLLKNQSSSPEANQTLQTLIKALGKENLFPEDALPIFEKYPTSSESIIEHVLAELHNPHLALDFLKRLESPYPLTAHFAKFALKLNDWVIASAIALEVKRLEGSDVTPLIFSRQIYITQAQLPVVENLMAQGVRGELIWRAAKALPKKRDIKFQIPLGKICSSRGSCAEINLFFADQVGKKIPLEAQLDIIQSDLVPLTILWTILKQGLIKESKILQAFLNRLSQSKEFEVNFKIMAELCSIVPAQEMKGKVAEIFTAQTEEMKEWEPERFWKTLQVLFSVPKILSFIPIVVWERAFAISRNAFVIQGTTVDRIAFLLHFVEPIKIRFPRSEVCDRFFNELIHLSEILTSQTIPLETLWNKVIRHLPKNKELFELFFARFKARTDYSENFKLLSSMLSEEPGVDLGKYPAELFSHYLEQIRAFPIETTWEVLKPLTSVPKLLATIPQAEWEKVFSLTLKKIESEPEESKNLRLISVLTASLIGSPLWNEVGLLFLCRGLDLAAPHYSSDAKIVWEGLIAVAPTVLKNAAIHQEVGAHIDRIFQRLFKNIDLTSQSKAQYTWTQTPMSTKKDFIESLNQLLTDRPINFGFQWFSQWIKLPQIKWELGDFFNLLMQVEKIYALGDYQLAIASQYLLLFHFGRYIDSNPHPEIPDYYLLTIECFHKAFQKSYVKAHTLCEEDDKANPFPYTNQLNEFFMQPGNKPERLEVHEVICKITEINPRAYLLTRIVSIHATLLNLGRTESRCNVFLAPVYETWSKELFVQYRALHFFLLYERSTFTAILRELFEILSLGKLPEISFLMGELTLLIKNHPMFKELSREEKRGLFAVFISDILTITNTKVPSSYLILRATFEFTKEALRSPEWEIEINIGSILFAQIQFLIVFNQNDDLQRALESAENLIPLVTKYQQRMGKTNGEMSFKMQVSLEKQDYYTHLNTLVGVIVKEREIEKAIDSGLKSPAHAKYAAAVQTKKMEYQKKLELSEKKQKQLASTVMMAGVKAR